MGLEVETFTEKQSTWVLEVEIFFRNAHIVIKYIFLLSFITFMENCRVKITFITLNDYFQHLKRMFRICGSKVSSVFFICCETYNIHRQNFKRQDRRLTVSLMIHVQYLIECLNPIFYGVQRVIDRISNRARSQNDRRGGKNPKK